jgi:hypothetical protein
MAFVVSDARVQSFDVVIVPALGSSRRAWDVYVLS